MILPESRNLEWIEKAAKDNNASNPILVEKVIRVRNFIHTERYNMIGAVRDASKAAYAAACSLNSIVVPERYNPQEAEALADARIPASFSSRLNALKTQNPEAFFYWLKTSELMK